MTEPAAAPAADPCKLRDREPVRVYLYSVAAALVAALLTFGLVTGDQAAAILGLATALTAVPAVEAARAKTVPTAELPKHSEPVDYVPSPDGSHGDA